MFILKGSGLLGSGANGHWSGYSVMARVFGKTAYTCRISLIIHKAAHCTSLFHFLAFQFMPWWNVGMADPGTTEKGRV